MTAPLLYSSGCVLSMTNRKKILVSSNTSWNIVNFRSNLLKAFLAKGYEVVVLSPADEYSAVLVGLGCRHIHISMDNKGINPVKDLASVARYLTIMRSERPSIYLSWTIKPNIYGSVAAGMLRIPVINNVSGLGTAFLRSGWLTHFVNRLYRWSFAKSRHVFFQNEDDRNLFVCARLVRRCRTGLLPGSGIDLQRFVLAPMPHRSPAEGLVFLLVARMLWDKGLGEYIEAAREVRRLHPKVRFQLLGFLDADNQSAIPRSVMTAWQREGIIEYLGSTQDVRPYIEAADCVVLPSYREGTPRSLLEAAAIGRPIITTDAAGCRDVVDDGINGWLCEIRNAEDLAKKVCQLIVTTSEKRAEMGRQSRLMAEHKFDERFVIQSYLNAVENVFKFPQLQCQSV